MIRPDLKALCIALLPAMALADHDMAPEPGEIDLAVDVCIINTEHPKHHSDGCQAFLYGIAYQRRLQITELTNSGGQTFNQVPGQIRRWGPVDQLLYQNRDLLEQSVDPQVQTLDRRVPEVLIIPKVPDGLGGDLGQIVR